jgi:choline-sulfatase
MGRLLAAMLACAACSTAPADDPLAELRPGMLAGSSLLVVTLDTTRPDHLGCYGAKDAATPVVDRLAAEGIRVEHAVAPAPVTLPSHASLFTGLDPATHGVRMNGEFRLAAERTTLAEALAARGWETAAFVSAFVLDARFGLAQGFATYDDRMPRAEGAVFPAGTVERSARATTDAAIAWIERRAGTAPFLLWVHYFDAHAPYAPPADLAARFAGRPYDGEIASVDRELGRLVDAMRGTRATILVVGDHGESLGEHGELTHGVFLYDATVRVPMILRPPDGAVRGVVADRVVSLVDVVPTLLDLLGVESPGPLDGVSLVGTRPDPARAVRLESLTPYLDFGWAPLHALRRRDDKYVAAPRPEYYDLRRDPAETVNRADDPVAGALAARLVTTPATAHAAVDAPARERLEALGYLAGAGPDDARPRRDPKDMIRVANATIEATALLAAGEADRARAILEPIAAESPGDRSLLHALAKVYLRLGRVRDAEARLRALTAIRPKADTSLLLAQIVLLDGRADEASRWLTQAASLEPEHGGVAIARGDLALAGGRAAEARGHYRRAAEIDPSRAAGTAAARLARVPPK